MKKNILINHPVRVVVFMLLAMSGLGYGATTNYYVWRDNPGPLSPFTNWAMAATSIQDAVDLTINDDTVYVTNGTYDTGGRPYSTYLLTNRVMAGNAITIRSMNGPTNTIIKGKPDDVTGACGDAAVRCALLVGGSMIGFTLTNGHTMTNGDAVHNQYGGGLFLRGAAVVSNCVLSGNIAWNIGGGAYVWYSGVLNNCIIAGNTATNSGGGASLMDTVNDPPRAVMNYCIVSNNTSPASAGVALSSGGGVINHCTVANNTASGPFATGGGVSGSGNTYNSTIAGNIGRGQGGGIYLPGGTISNCVISGNVLLNNGSYGGGVWLVAGEMVNCIVSNNRASRGSGVRLSGGLMRNCLLADNVATNDNGGGAYLPAACGTMTNCTITRNMAVGGGGVWVESLATGVVNNCVIWGNTGGASSNVLASNSAAITFTCSGPVQSGTGNTGADPQFAGFADGNYRLAANSPCVNAGLNQSWMTGAVDLDGRRRLDRFSGLVDMGAYEHIYNGTVYGVR